jgi:Do/DeqQ family serine protease
MNAKTITKSLLSGVVGALIVLIAFIFFIPNKDNTSNENLVSQSQTVNNNLKPLVHSANYTPPQQAVDLTCAAEKSLDAVVHIKTQIVRRTNSYDDFFGQFKEYFHQNPRRNNSYIAFGSGVIISSDGYIVTNNHVIDGADKITITFNDERETDAEIVGVDPSTDLALIKVAEKDLPYISFGNSDDVKIGEWVLAVGNPFDLNSTVTAGIVSAKARNINILGGQSAIESFIQTDAVVNRGNSGGALVNTKGDLVGINAAIASHTGVYEGYSFAIPVNIVRKVVNDIMEYGEAQRGYLGVQIQDINAEFAEAVGLENTAGIYIASVMANGGAEEAGLREGDVIISINGKKTNTLSSLLGMIGQYNPGTVVDVQVNRDGKIKNFKVTLKNKNGTVAAIKSTDSFYNEILGADLTKLSDSESNDLNINGGLKVNSIGNGILSRSGINEGFIITEINGSRVDSQSKLQSALNNTHRNIIRLKGMYPNGVRVAYEFML